METNRNQTVTSRRMTKGRTSGIRQYIVIPALFVAMSIVLGKLLAINIGTSIRISFENLPILMAGIFCGSAVGGAVGLGADLIGCLIVGYAINPFITLGSALIGIISGLVSKYAFKGSFSLPSVACSVGASHVVSSMIVKSIGMYIYYNTPLEVLLTRIPIYIVVGTAETYMIYLLLKNKAFSAEVERMCRK